MDRTLIVDTEDLADTQHCLTQLKQGSSELITPLGLFLFPLLMPRNKFFTK